MNSKAYQNYQRAIIKLEPQTTALGQRQHKDYRDLIWDYKKLAREEVGMPIYNFNILAGLIALGWRPPENEIDRDFLSLEDLLG